MNAGSRMHRHFSFGRVALLSVLSLVACTSAPPPRPTEQTVFVSGMAELPSWKETITKASIAEFVMRVTTEGAPDYLPPARRIAVFQNNGALCVEQPADLQTLFVIQRVQTLAPQHPAWKGREPFRSAIAGNIKGVTASGDSAKRQLLAATHAGTSSEAYRRAVEEWSATAIDPRFKRPYGQLVYQPMIEMLKYLRANGFEIYLVATGDIDFMRAFAEKAYGIAPSHVIATARSDANPPPNRQTSRKAPRKGARPPSKPDDTAAKVAPIAEAMNGRSPVLAFGSADNDLPLLKWTDSQAGAHLVGIVRHTDATREYNYDGAAKSPLPAIVREARTKGWVMVDMKDDWKTIFPESRAGQ